MGQRKEQPAEQPLTAAMYVSPGQGLSVLGGTGRAPGVNEACPPTRPVSFAVFAALL